MVTSAELRSIGFSVFAYATCSAGPRRLDAREPQALSNARMGDVEVGSDHVVFADDDGSVFVPAVDVDVVLTAATTILETERNQASLIPEG